MIQYSVELEMLREAFKTLRDHLDADDANAAWADCWDIRGIMFRLESRVAQEYCGRKAKEIRDMRGIAGHEPPD